MRTLLCRGTRHTPRFRFGVRTARRSSARRWSARTDTVGTCRSTSTCRSASGCVITAPVRNRYCLGIGPSAISIFADAYAQNAKLLEAWSSDIDVGRLATCRGLNLSEEDLLRQAVIEQLYCNAAIDKARIEESFGIDFDQQFADELARLAELDNDGLVELGHSHIRLTFPLGRLLLRVVAVVFDTYLPRDAFRIGQSAQLVSKVG
jgi:hypothetical protein